MNRARWLGTLSVAGFMGCGLNLPDEWRIEDLRILDVRAAPPEIPLFVRAPGQLDLDPNNLPPLARASVTLTALVAHPDLDATLTLTWARCPPGLAAYPCDEGELTALAPVGTASLSFVPSDVLTAELSGSADLTGVLQSIIEDPRDLLNGLYASVVLNAGVAEARQRVDTPSLDGRKRLVVFEPRLVAATIDAARGASSSSIAAGLGGLPTLCTQVTDAQAAGLRTFLDARVPNRAPLLLGVESDNPVLTATTATITVGRGAPLVLPAGRGVRLSARYAEADEEPYQQIDSDCQLQDFKETASASWFTRSGKLSRQLTTTDEPRVSYTAPLEAGRDRIWVVLRDGRGGSDHLTIDVIVTP